MTYQTKTVDGQSVKYMAPPSDGMFEVALTSALQATVETMTAYTDLGCGIADTFLYDSVLPVMTAATIDDVTITSSTNLTNLEGWRVADNQNSSTASWVASASPTTSAVQWVKISKATAGLMSSYNMITRNDSTYVYSPRSWKMYISTVDNPATYTSAAAWAGATAEWTEVHSVDGNTVNTPATKLGDYPFATPYTWKHIAIVIMAANNGGSARVSIGELNIYAGGVNTWQSSGVEVAKGYVRPTPPISIPIMTSDTTPSGVCSASTTYSVDYPAWKAADKVNNGTDGWGSSAIPTDAAPQWWQYEFATAATITSMSMKNRETYPNSPNVFSVYATNSVSPGTDYTNVEWTKVLDTTVNANNNGGADLGPWPFINTGSYTKYRISEKL